MRAAALAVLGTGSDVGKSIVTTALCRHFFRCGLRVAPFKSQNMSNNSGVTPEGGEMGRAQIVQAEAAGIAPHVDMNPVLLKPTGETGAQIVLLGKVLAEQSAKEYHGNKSFLFKEACRAYDRLADIHDVMILEGAGSCAEVNLMAHDIVNLKMAEYAGAKVLLVGDIHRGGIFAQLIGTLACLSEREKACIAGFVINRFRGDIGLFRDGVDFIEKKTGIPVFGVLPWFDHIHIEAEDSVVIESPGKTVSLDAGRPAIGVVKFPHISNFNDFDALIDMNGIDVAFLDRVQNIDKFTALILPGTKNTRKDLEWLHKTGWADMIMDYVENGGNLLGICGGYQMLGTVIEDPDGIEEDAGRSKGLGLLPVETLLASPKTTTLTEFAWGDEPGSGYEIHMGRTELAGGDPLIKIRKRNRVACDETDGSIRDDARVMGTYMHGFFDTPGITAKWLEMIGVRNMKVPDVYGLKKREREYDLLAGHFERYVDVDAVKRFLK